MGACTFSMKISLGLISLVFWGISAGFLFVGGYVYHTYHDFEHFTTSTLTLIPATIMIIVGVVMFIIGCIGFLAAAKESRFVLACFFSMVLVVLLMEVAVAILAFAFSYTVKLENAVKGGLKDAIHDYPNSTAARNEMDYVQKTLQCCGVTNYTDWEADGQAMPQSCWYKNGSHYNFYHEGCETKLSDMFEENLKYIAVVAIAFALLQVVGMLFSCLLFCRYKGRDTPYSLLGNTGGLTV